MKFPKPWKFEQTGPLDACVFDANGRLLFVIKGDEPDDDRVGSVLFWSEDDAENDALFEEVGQMVEGWR